MPVRAQHYTVPAGYQSAGTGAYSYSTANTITLLDHEWVVSNVTATTMTLTIDTEWQTLGYGFDRYGNTYLGYLGGYGQRDPEPAPEPLPAPPAPTPEEEAAAQAAHVAAVEAAMQHRADLQAQRRAASARAEELLDMMLSTEQLADRAVHGYFEVLGSEGGRYRIYRGTTGNVHRLSPFADEQEDESLCAHPPLDVPQGDVHLAQLLALTTDEPAFRRVANISVLR